MGLIIHFVAVNAKKIVVVATAARGVVGVLEALVIVGVVGGSVNC